MYVHVGSRLDAVRAIGTLWHFHIAACFAFRVINGSYSNAASAMVRRLWSCPPIIVALQNAYGLGYKAVYDDRAAVQTVIDDFAKRFSLPANDCTAWLVQKRLKGNELLLQV